MYCILSVAHIRIRVRKLTIYSYIKDAFLDQLYHIHLNIALVRLHLNNAVFMIKRSNMNIQDSVINRSI